MFAEGNFAPLKEWLNTNVHRFGRQFVPSRLIERVTGAPLSHRPLTAHLKSKAESIYRL